MLALGTPLIELALNLRFNHLRHAFHTNSLSLSLGLNAAGTNTLRPLDNNEAANTCMQPVYLETGDLHGYAVWCCLRCEFPRLGRHQELRI